MPRFTGVPTVPTSGLPELQANLFGALKENVELLIGSRGETDFASRALLIGDVSAKQVGTQVLGSVQNISPEGFTISSQDVASLAAFRGLKTDVQELANDLFRTRRALDLLIENFGGR
jgi:hypothetical protein